MNCGESAAYDLQAAAKLVATGVCAIDESEPDKETLVAAVATYKRSRPSKQRWELPVGTASIL